MAAVLVAVSVTGCAGVLDRVAVVTGPEPAAASEAAGDAATARPTVFVLRTVG